MEAKKAVATPAEEWEEGERGGVKGGAGERGGAEGGGLCRPSAN